MMAPGEIPPDPARAQRTPGRRRLRHALELTGRWRLRMNPISARTASRFRLLGLALLLAASTAQAQTADPPAVLLIVDRGHLDPADVMAAADGLRRLVALFPTSTVAAVSGSTVIEATDAGDLAHALAGAGGFFDEIGRAQRLTPAEAWEIFRGNDSVRDGLARERCAAPSGDANCGAALRPLSRQVLDDLQTLASNTIGAMARTMADRCSTGPGLRTIIFATPGLPQVSTPRAQLTSLENNLDACRARLVIVRLESTTVPWRAGDGLKDLVTATRSTVHELSGVLRAPEAFARLVTPGAPSVPSSPGPSTPADVQRIVDLASRQVEVFIASNAVLIAREHYVQEIKRRPSTTGLLASYGGGITVERRTLDSEVALVQVGRDDLWLLARDIERVDDRALPPSERGSLANATPDTRDAALAYFRELADRGARFNIGDVDRNINVPTLALWFLSGSNRTRFAFRRTGRETVGRVACDVLSYEEHRAPYLLQVQGVPAPTRGRIWVAPATGLVVRTELILADDAAARGRAATGTRAVITVDYAHSSDVDSWVPASMTERYDARQGLGTEFIVGRAEYRDFRRFDVQMRLVSDPR